MEKTINQQQIFLSYFFAIFAMFLLSIHYLMFLTEKYHITVFVSATAFLCFSLASFCMVIHVKAPLRTFGFKMDVSGKDWFVTLSSTACICGLLVLVKYYISLYLLPNVLVFNNLLFQVQHNRDLMVSMLIYAGFCPFQVFIVNSAFQGGILSFFQNKGMLSIFLSTVLFALIHIVINWLLAVLMLFFGLYWSVLFYKQRSIITISVSHMIIGIWGFYILGYLPVLKTLSQML